MVIPYIPTTYVSAQYAIIIISSTHKSLLMQQGSLNIELLHNAKPRGTHKKPLYVSSEEYTILKSSLYSVIEVMGGRIVPRDLNILRCTSENERPAVEYIKNVDYREIGSFLIYIAVTRIIKQATLSAHAHRPRLFEQGRKQIDLQLLCGF